MYGYIEGGLKSTHALTQITGSFTGQKDIALKLKRNVLSSGVYYKFKLTVTDSLGIVAFNTFELRTNSVPAKGTCFLSVDIMTAEDIHGPRTCFSFYMYRSSLNQVQW